MSDKDFELAPWIVGLVAFALTPAIIFLIGSAFVALFLVFAMLLIANLPFSIWALLTGTEFKPRFYSLTEENKQEK